MARIKKSEAGVRKALDLANVQLEVRTLERASFITGAKSLQGALLLVQEFLAMQVKRPDLTRWDKFVLVSLDHWVESALRSAQNKGLIEHA